MTDEQLPVLIVDDQGAVVNALEVLFDIHRIPHLAAATPGEATRIASNRTLGAILQDMNFEPNETSGEAGIELFQALREAQPGVPVLLMTAWASLETAVQLVKEGATDYIEKPWDDEKLVVTVRNLLALRRLEIENRELRTELKLSRAAIAEQYDLCGLVYASEAMHRAVSLAVSIAASDAPVLITGPSGSGKERIAEIIQANSRRRKGPFVRVNVGAIPEELMESELFGAEAGAYTSLRSRRLGHFESANGGTLFLDEIDALSLAGQVKLLRVLQSGEFQRLGSSRTLRADVRVVSATNIDLRRAIENGDFREDLYFRLNVVEIGLPGLNERRDDILPLAEFFLASFAAEQEAEPLTSSRETEQTLLAHDWSGNVRELENRIQRATLVAAGPTIEPADLGLGKETEDPSFSVEIPLTGSQVDERRELLAILESTDGIVVRAAGELGISRQALYRKMTRLGIELERRPKIS